MKHHHDRNRRRPARVAEPVQVYLDPPDRERLERLAARLDATKSDVLRQGLVALEAQTRHAAAGHAAATPLPTFAGQGLQPGVDLDDTASLQDLMDARDADG
jgi:hypothetical protein